MQLPGYTYLRTKKIVKGYSGIIKMKISPYQVCKPTIVGIKIKKKRRNAKIRARG